MNEFISIVSVIATLISDIETIISAVASIISGVKSIFTDVVAMIFAIKVINVLLKFQSKNKYNGLK